MILFDLQGNPVDIPNEQVDAALRSGQYTAEAGAKVKIVDQAGTGRAVSVEELPKALDYGARMQTEFEKRKQEISEKYGGTFADELGAFALGAARGVSFGLSDVAARALGMSEEDLRGLQEANPAASFGGEVTGVLGSMIGGGPLKLLGEAKGLIGGAAKTTEVLTATPRAVAELGYQTSRVAQRAMVRALGKQAETSLGRVMTRAVEMGAGNAVEGAIYGAGAFVSEAALGDTDVTVDSLLAHTGTGALLGGGFGAALGAGFERAALSLNASAKFTRAEIAEEVKMVERATGQKMSPEVGEALYKKYREVAKVVTGKPQEIENLLGPGGAANRAAAIIDDSEVDRLTRELAAKQDKLIEMNDRLRELTTSESRRAAWSKIADDSYAPIAADSTRSLYTDIIADLDGAISKGGGEYGYIPTMRKIKSEAEARLKRLSEFQSNPRPGVVADIAADVDSIKHDIWEATRRSSRYTTSTDQATHNKLFELGTKAKTHLEDSRIFGEAVSKSQKEINESFSKGYLTEVRRRPDHHIFEMYDGPNFKLVKRTNLNGMRGYVKDLGTDASLQDREWLLSQMRGQMETAEIVEKHFTTGPEYTKLLNESRDALMDYEKMHTKLMHSMTMRNQLATVERVGGNLNLAILGALVGGAPGAVIAGAASMLMNPAKVIRPLAHLSKLIGNVQSRISGGISAYIGEATRAVEAGVSTVARRGPSLARKMTMPVVSDLKAHAERRERYDRRMRELASSTANIKATLANMDKSTSLLREIAPRAASMLQDRGLVAVKHLYDTAPKDPTALSPLVKSRWSPPALALDAWERRLRVADNPLSVIDDLRKGTLSSEGVDTLRTLFPALHRQIVTELAQQISEKGDKIPYNDRVRMSHLFGLPLDSTMDPQFVVGMQEAGSALIAQVGAQAQQQAARQIGNAVEKVSKRSRSYMTEAQRLSQGGTT